MSTNNVRWLIGLTLILTALVGLAAPAAAQDGAGTPAPDNSSSHVTGYHLEVLFPVVIRFFVDVNVPPSQITDITFDLEAAGGVDKSISLTTADSVVIQTDTASRLAYEWSLQEAPQPAPFGTVNYKWTIKTSDGVESEAVNEFTFTDSNHGNWRDGGNPPLKLYWQGQYLDANPAWYEIMPVYNLLSDNTGLSPQLAYAVYDPNVQLCSEVQTRQQASR